MGVVFSTTNSGINEQNNALIGRYETPIRMIIKNESDQCAKNDDLVKALFEVQKSKKFGESIVTENEFDLFTPTDEGGKAPNVTYKTVAEKFLKHTTFKSQFRITQEMMEDSLTNQITAKAEKHTRSYYRTRNLFASKLLSGALGGADGTNKTITFGSKSAQKTFDITTADGKALFSALHETGANRFYHILGSGVKISNAAVKAALSAGVEKIRNMKDETGYAMGYTADTIVIPGDDYPLEQAVKEVLGSEYGNGEGGVLSGSINIHYGNWTLVVDPLWVRADKTVHPIVVMSSQARRNLQAAIFFDRRPLTIRAHVDQETDDYIWNGSARMVGGFTTHKHACLFEILDNNTTVLLDKGVAGTSTESQLISL
ncbi:MAG: hypothetical protein E7590_00980 [Ruminococcaceae bacterium]|nr:hypothetical protein [Oscillospiraceae bacterium]